MDAEAVIAIVKLGHVGVPLVMQTNLPVASAKSDAVNQVYNVAHSYRIPLDELYGMMKPLLPGIMRARHSPEDLSRVAMLPGYGPTYADGMRQAMDCQVHASPH